MTPDLRTLLAQAARDEEHRAAADAPDPTTTARTVATFARRRRTVRTAALAAGAVAAVAVGALGIHGLARPTPGPPAVPAPAQPTPAVGEVTTHPGLPTAVAMQPGMLEDAGPGWALVLYGAPALADDAMPPTVLYLVGPDGQVVEVPSALTLDGADRPVLLEWAPGTSSVLARIGPDHRPEYAVLDLLTGEEVLRLDGESLSAELVGDGTGDLLVTMVGGDGTVSLDRMDPWGQKVAATTLASTGAAAEPGTTVSWLTSPDRTAILGRTTSDLTILDATDLTPQVSLSTPYPDVQDACRSRAWVEAGVVLVCGPEGWTQAGPGPSSALWLAPVDGGPAQPIGPAGALADLSVRSVWAVQGRTVLRVREQDDDGTLRLVEADGPLLTELPAPEAGWARLMAGTGDRLLAVTIGGDDDSEFGLISVDPFAGATTELIGRPEQPVPGVGLVVLGVVEGTTEAEGWQ
ncbi:hypothetical protein [Actinotalea sp. K2]|uniref:hypothetical protein n=1 Tax=Actinotalea sp. K2 TaxID=2939438 RepID=UPI0020176422|nr:hypothetical protein [Actinotalea sp. K2]MCL3863134.1 hypothetical protein [Actinotalea sp. K2]